MSKKSVLCCIVAIVVILSFASCSNASLSPGTTDTAAASDFSENSSNISVDSTIASAEVYKDIACMVYVMKENLNHNFLLGDDGYPSDISVVFYSDSKAVFEGERSVCLAKKDDHGEWMYYVLDCNYFGSGDYRVLGNKDSTYVAISDYSNQILILNTETKMVSLLRFETDESVSFISWDSDVLYFKCQSTSVPAYAYDAKTYSINSISQKDQIPGSTSDLKEYDTMKILNEIFVIK